MKLREYQVEAIRALRAQYAAGRTKPCLVMPTGSGKTPTSAEIIRSALAKGKRVGFLAGRLELLDQARSKLAEAGVSDVRFIQAENDTGASSPVFVASAQTLASKRWSGELPPADILVIDEVHHLKARTWTDIAKSYPILLGLTATPERGDGQALGDMLDAIVVGATVKQLTELGHLVPSRTFAPPTILDSRTLALEPVDAYRKHCNGTKSIVFCATVEHARKTAEAFAAEGITAEYVSGAMSERSDVIARFKDGAFRVLVNVNLLVEGFDDPAIEAAIFARRFTHVGGYLQACGRILRPYKGKSLATIVDLCGSALVHGTPDIEREYSLEGKAISKADRVAIRQCPGCGGVFATRDVCPYCELEQPKAIRALPTASGVGLEEVPKATPTSWPMKSKKRSLCAGCGAVIDEGQWIVYSAISRVAKHAKCAARRAAA